MRLLGPGDLPARAGEPSSLAVGRTWNIVSWRLVDAGEGFRIQITTVGEVAELSDYPLHAALELEGREPRTISMAECLVLSPTIRLGHATYSIIAVSPPTISDAGN